LYSSIILLDWSQNKDYGMAGSMPGDMRGVYKMLAGNFEGKRPLGRPRRRWQNKIKMTFREIGS
jgi:hypothetical protein